MSNLLCDAYLENKLKEFVNFLEYADKAAWRKIRMSGIGGSNISAVCGENPYETPLGIYLDKTGYSKEKIMTFAMEWGTRSEDMLIKKFQDVTGFQTFQFKKMMQHKKYTFALANVDSFIKLENDTLGILECKTTKMPIDENNLPVYYILQLQWYLFVTGLDIGYLAILCNYGRGSFIIKKIMRDDELIESMIKIAEKFWTQYVLKETPPSLKFTNYETDSVNALYPKATSTDTINLEPIADELTDTYEKTSKKIKELQEIKQSSANQLKSLIGDYKSGRTPYGHKITWSNGSRESLDQEKLLANYPDLYKECLRTKNYRMLRITAPK